MLEVKSLSKRSQDQTSFSEDLRPFRNELNHLIRGLLLATKNPLDQRRYVQKGIIHGGSSARKALEFTCNTEGKPIQIEQIPKLAGIIDQAAVWNPLLLALVMQLHEVGGVLEMYLGGKGGHELIGKYHSSLTAFGVAKLLSGKTDELLQLKHWSFENKNYFIESSPLQETLNNHGIALQDILEPLADHGVISYNGSNPITLATRDIDKSDNGERVFRDVPSFEKQMTLIDRLTEGALSPDVKNEFVLEGKVKNVSVNTKIDWIVKTLAWRLDLNFTYWRERWDELILPGQIKLLKNFTNDNSLIDLVLEKLDTETVNLDFIV